jgi:repressor LexA
MDTLPRRQHEIAEFIREHIESHGVPPTYREVADHFDLMISTVQESLAALERKGVVERIRGKSRGLRLAPSMISASRNLPIMGLTTAGEPAEAIEMPEGYLSVDASLSRGEHVFALKVKGESMIEAGILDGDYAILRQQDDVENGEAALVLIDGEDATIKHVFKRGRRVELRPANSAMEPKFIDASRVRIQGKVVGVFRAYGK